MDILNTIALFFSGMFIICMTVVLTNSYQEVTKEKVKSIVDTMDIEQISSDIDFFNTNHNVDLRQLPTEGRWGELIRWVQEQYITTHPDVGKKHKPDMYTCGRYVELVKRERELVTEAVA